jgi:hypothetical protein
LLVRDLGTEFDGTDKALLAVADEFYRQSATGHMDLHGLDQLIRRHVSRNPALLSIRITNARGGVLVGFDGDSPPPNSDIDERDYFIQQRDNPNAGLVFAHMGLNEIEANFAKLQVGPKGSVVLRDAQLGIMVLVAAPSRRASARLAPFGGDRPGKRAQHHDRGAGPASRLPTPAAPSST